MSAKLVETVYLKDKEVSLSYYTDGSIFMTVRDYTFQIENADKWGDTFGEVKHRAYQYQYTYDKLQAFKQMEETLATGDYRLSATISSDWQPTNMGSSDGRHEQQTTVETFASFSEARKHFESIFGEIKWEYHRGNIRNPKRGEYQQIRLFLIKVR